MSLYQVLFFLVFVSCAGQTTVEGVDNHTTVKGSAEAQVETNTQGTGTPPADAGDFKYSGLVGNWKSKCNSMKDVVIGGVQSKLKGSSYIQAEITKDSMSILLEGYGDNDCAKVASTKQLVFKLVSVEEFEDKGTFHLKMKVKLTRGSLMFSEASSVDLIKSACKISAEVNKATVITPNCPILFDAIRRNPDENDVLTLTAYRGKDYSTFSPSQILSDASLYFSKLMVKDGNTEEIAFLKKAYGEKPPRIFEFGIVSLSKMNADEKPKPPPPELVNKVGQVFFLNKPSSPSKDANAVFEFAADRKVKKYIVTLDNAAKDVTDPKWTTPVTAGTHKLKLKADFEDGTQSAEIEHSWKKE